MRNLTLLQRLPLALAMLLLGFAYTNAYSQTARQRPPPSALTLGPGLLEYRMLCAADCKITCFQNGDTVFTHNKITAKDQIRLFASRHSTEDLTPRWIEIRPASKALQGKPRTLLLSQNTFCDFNSLTIEPTNIR